MPRKAWKKESVHVPLSDLEAKILRDYMGEHGITNKSEAVRQLICRGHAHKLGYRDIAASPTTLELIATARQHVKASHKAMVDELVYRGYKEMRRNGWE